MTDKIKTMVILFLLLRGVIVSTDLTKNKEDIFMDFLDYLLILLVK